MAKVTVYKQAAFIAAEIAGRSSKMDAKARQVQATAKSIAAKHKQDGDFIASIEIDQRTYRARTGHKVRTLEVVSKDELAWHKEFGHIATSNSNAKNPKTKHEWVEGLKIMQQAALAHGGKSGGG